MQYKRSAMKVSSIWLALFMTSITLFIVYPMEKSDPSQGRLAGIRYQKSLMNALTLLSSHQSLSARSHQLSKKGIQSLLTLQTSVDASIDQIEFLYGKSLRFDLPDTMSRDYRQSSMQNIQALKKEWGELKQQRASLNPAEHSERHRQMLKRLRVESVRCAQMFELDKHMNSIDSELVRIVTQTIPEIYEQMSSIKAIAPKHVLTEADRSAASEAIKVLEGTSSERLAEFESPLQDFILEAKKLASSEVVSEPNKIGSRLFHSEKTIQDLQMKGLETIAQNMKVMLTLGQGD